MPGVPHSPTEAVTGSSSLPLAPYDTPWDGPAAEQAIFTWATPDGEKQFSPAKAKQCFLYCDSTRPELRASYKLPFCRIAAGKPQIVPKAVFAIAGVLNGAMGGLKGVSDADKAALQRKVTALYHQIATANPKQQVEPPFDKTGESVLNPSSTPRDPVLARGGGTSQLHEAQRLLTQAGWQLSRPKSETEKLQEHISAQLAELRETHARELAELRAQVHTPATSQPPPQATPASPTAGANHPNSIRGSLYSHGKYLRERLTTLDWVQLADRTAPLPDDLQLDWLLKEFEQLYAVQYDDRFHVLSAQDAELR